jgi:hypothetical protein
MALNLYDFYRNLTTEGIMFCFSGPTSQSVVEGIGQTLRKKMELEEAGTSTTSKVFAVFVEQMQNIINYSSEKVSREFDGHGELRFGILVVTCEQGHYAVRCGNYVTKDTAEKLQEMLRELQGKSKDDLKSLYKELRRKSEIGGASKGAGLGLIEMARKASRPLDFEIVQVDEQNSFFSITAVV